MSHSLPCISRSKERKETRDGLGGHSISHAPAYTNTPPQPSPPPPPTPRHLPPPTCLTVSGAGRLPALGLLGPLRHDGLPGLLASPAGCLFRLAPPSEWHPFRSRLKDWVFFVFFFSGEAPFLFLPFFVFGWEGPDSVPVLKWTREESWVPTCSILQNWRIQSNLASPEVGGGLLIRVARLVFGSWHQKFWGGLKGNQKEMLDFGGYVETTHVF